MYSSLSSNKTLIIVDCQPEFNEALTRKVKEGIILLVRKCIEALCPIIVLEYFDELDSSESRYDNRTIYSIRKELKGYNNVEYLDKCDDSGACEIYDYCNLHGLGKEFVLAGVRKSACVYSTIEGLHHLDCKCSLALDATNDGYSKTDLSYQWVRQLIAERERELPKLAHFTTSKDVEFSSFIREKAYA